MVRPQFKSQERQQLLLRSVEGHLPWVLGVMFSDTVTCLRWPLGKYFRTGFLKVWASELLGKKPLASGIDQSFGFQPYNEVHGGMGERLLSACGEPAPQQ